MDALPIFDLNNLKWDTHTHPWSPYMISNNNQWYPSHSLHIVFIINIIIMRCGIRLDKVFANPVGGSLCFEDAWQGHPFRWSGKTHRSFRQPETAPLIIGKHFTLFPIFFWCDLQVSCDTRRCHCLTHLMNSGSQPSAALSEHWFQLMENWYEIKGIHLTFVVIKLWNVSDLVMWRVWWPTVTTCDNLTFDC